MDDVRSRIDGVVEEFVDLDGREKLELLVEYSSALPPLTAEYKARQAVAECRDPRCG
jgi:sulfur transfer protein SufE